MHLHIIGGKCEASHHKVLDYAEQLQRENPYDAVWIRNGAEWPAAVTEALSGPRGLSRFCEGERLEIGGYVVLHVILQM